MVDDTADSLVFEFKVIDGSKTERLFAKGVIANEATIKDRSINDNSFIFDRKDKSIGTVTSATWSPTTKSNLALASLNTPWGQPGQELSAEIYYIRELQWTRVMMRCRVVKKAFFDPERRHVTPAWDF